MDRAREANQRIRAEVARDSLQAYVDVFTPMLGANGQPRAELFLADSLHMTRAGYCCCARGWRRSCANAQAEGRMDEDLASMSREELIGEVRKLRHGIRTHRDSTGQELCWHHPALWGLLPEKQDPLPIVPEWAEFIRGCVRYRQSLDEQAPNAPRSQ